MDVLTALVSVAIGALLGGGVNALVGRYASFKESQALAAALRAELEVLLDVVEGRDHVGGLERTIIYLSSMTSQAKSDQFYDVMRAANDSYSVFHANCSRLGLLGGAAEPVVAAYMRFKGVDADLEGLAERQQRSPLNHEQLLHVHVSTRELLVQALRRSRVAVNRLREHEEQRFFRRSTRRGDADGSTR